MMVEPYNQQGETICSTYSLAYKLATSAFAIPN